MAEFEECCSYTECLLCAIRSSPNPAAAARELAKLLKDLPLQDDSIWIVRGIWSSAMAHSDDATLVKAGALECMVAISKKGRGALPYYAAHALGSYTMNVEAFALRAVRAGAVAAMAELLAGRLSWVEQRAAARTLSHLSSYDSTFPAVAGHGGTACGILRLAMRMAVAAPYVVYDQFVGRAAYERVRHHRKLLACSGGGAAELRKAEDWAGQLQCWSLQIVNCFAGRDDRSLVEICSQKYFLDRLPTMWGGLVVGSSPGGIGLLRTICYHKFGRNAVSRRPKVIEALCNVARSSDHWQYMAVDCLLWLLRDPKARLKVLKKSALALADLIQASKLGEQKNAGNMIMEFLVFVRRQLDAEFVEIEATVHDLLDYVTKFRKRIQLEKLTTREDISIKRAAALVLRLEGNSRFSCGDFQGALEKYNEALEVCPTTSRRDRITIFNNRVECWLLTGEPQRAISDTTRAICLCQGRSSLSVELSNSLWRRAVAYDILGLAKESLLDLIMFINLTSTCFGDDNCSSRGIEIDLHRLVKKQMRKIWVFRDAARQHRHKSKRHESDADDEDSECETASGSA